MQHLLWDLAQSGEWEDSPHQAWSPDTSTILDVPRGGTRLVRDIVQEVFPPGRHRSEGAAKHPMGRQFPHLFP